MVVQYIFLNFKSIMKAYQTHPAVGVTTATFFLGGKDFSAYALILKYNWSGTFQGFWVEMQKESFVQKFVRGYTPYFIFWRRL